jgi:ESS family glutamate:Na+ symporter
METFITYGSLVLLGLISLALYGRKNIIIQLVPTAVLIGFGLLAFGNYNPGFSENILDKWSSIPGLLINVVFACLLIGKKIMTPRKIWQFAGPQVVFGQTLAWGQYVIGALLALFILVPIFNMSPLSGALIEISFEGGHGTAAGLSGLFDELGFSEGEDLALGLATVGIMTGLATGLLMIAFRRKRRLSLKKHRKQAPIYKTISKYLVETQNEYLSHHRIMRTILQLSFIALAIAIGYLIKGLLIFFELTVLSQFTDIRFFEYVPLFPLAMIGGMIVQILLTTFRLNKLVHGKTILFIGNLSLELVIITAIATMSLIAISNNLAPFIILAAGGIAWNFVVFWWLGPKLLKSYWFERGIGDYGQSMGMTATGLLLMKAADSTNKSQAIERFGYKQLLFEPIVGGGLFTAVSMIIIAQFGLWNMLWITSAVLVGWLVLGYFSFIRTKKAS